jgi:hypothetical protein
LACFIGRSCAIFPTSAFINAVLLRDKKRKEEEEDMSTRIENKFNEAIREEAEDSDQLENEKRIKKERKNKKKIFI